MTSLMDRIPGLRRDDMGPPRDTSKWWRVAIVLVCGAAVGLAVAGWPSSTPNTPLVVPRATTTTVARVLPTVARPSTTTSASTSTSVDPSTTIEGTPGQNPASPGGTTATTAPRPINSGFTPATNPPATNPPATNPPATNPPATDPPATDPPPPDPNTTFPTNPPTTATSTPNTTQVTPTLPPRPSTTCFGGPTATTVYCI